MEPEKSIEIKAPEKAITTPAEETSIAPEPMIQGSAIAALSPAQIAAIAREEAEVRTAMIFALRNPRSEKDAWVKAMEACSRISLAQKAEYAYPRGGSTIRGPSVYLARELRRIWGNMRSGWKVVHETDEKATIQAVAIDLESNTWEAEEIIVARKIQRKSKITGQTEWVEPDERDKREFYGNMGARAERNCMLRLMPRDLVDDAVGRARETMKKGVGGDRSAQVKRMMELFGTIRVSPSMLEEHVGKKLEALTEEELMELRRLFNSIEEGHATVAQVFGGETTEINMPKRKSESAIPSEPSKVSPTPTPKTPKEPSASPVNPGSAQTASNVFTGTLVEVKQKSGQTNGKPWTRYGVFTLNGPTFSTFDSKLAESARELVGSLPVDITWEERDGYKTALAIAPHMREPGEDEQEERVPF